MNPKLYALDLLYQKHNIIIHYLIDPDKPAQNSKVERSHRSDQEFLVRDLWEKQKKNRKSILNLLPKKRK